MLLFVYWIQIVSCVIGSFLIAEQRDVGGLLSAHVFVKGCNQWVL